MGRNILFFALISFLLVAMYAYGAESRDIDFSSNSVQIVSLREGDEVRFNLLNGTHNVMLKEISRSLNSVKVGITPYIPNQVQVGLVGVDYVMNVDLNKDGYEDLKIDVFSIANESSATLILLDTSQKSAELISAMAVAETEESGLSINISEDYKRYIGYIAIVLGILILLLLIRKVRYAGLRSKGKKILEEEGRKKPEEKKEGEQS